jgi:seryl-tRNA synthetase
MCYREIRYTIPMLDIQFIRDNAELVAEKSKQKGYVVDISALLKLDTERRDLLSMVEALRQKRNQNSSNVKGRPDQSSIDEGKKIKIELTEKEEYLEEIEKKWSLRLRSVPNMAFDDVPVGDESASVEIKKFGDQKTGAIDHLDFAEKRGWVDFERGAKVAGAKFYFLKGDLALLENAITQFALDLILKKGFIYMIVPHMVSNRMVDGAGFAPRTSTQSDEYFIEDEDLTLIGTAEMSLTGYHADEIIDEKDMPLFYAGYSPSYRKEAGTYGKHAHGLFRVHQFNKLEMYVYCVPEQSKKIHEDLLKIEEEIWQALNIPYHIINIASGDLGAPAAKKYDLEYWSPVDGKYRELTSCSNCTDFQARNLNVRVRRLDGTVEPPHTLNATAVSLARSLIAVIEHYQNQDGTLRVPEVLQPYLGKREIL